MHDGYYSGGSNVNGLIFATGSKPTAFLTFLAVLFGLRSMPAFGGTVHLPNPAIDDPIESPASAGFHFAESQRPLLAESGP